MDADLIKDIEIKTMDTLKDFQCATVEKVHELFTSGQDRVLVADEVGLGKTLVARGVIAKTARRHFETSTDLFKVVYICSNQVIAKQNIRKLDVFNICHDDKPDDSRLSMQHLKIAKQEVLTYQRGDFAQLIPLTPTTSFSMTNGGGSMQERALMFAILTRIPELFDYLDVVSAFMSQYVANWEETVDDYCSSILEIEEKNASYPQNVIERILEYDEKTHIIDDLIIHVIELENNIQNYIKKDDGSSKRLESSTELSESDNSILKRLRVMFAEISVEMLKPNLVIMDEFQRFRDLIDIDSENTSESDNKETEERLIAKEFFDMPGIKVLLLSATPYKLYSTLEEIEADGGSDEHFNEFKQVIRFLIHDKSEKKEKEDRFFDDWFKYSDKLKEIIEGDTSVLTAKEEAEKAMRGLMCRTERISAMDTGDYIDDKSTKTPISITNGDVLTYLEMGKMLEEIGEERSLLVDYAKSAPFLMSYMNNYKVKELAEKHFKENSEDLSLAQKANLWIDRECIEHYGELPRNNARLEELKRHVFQHQSELYMWIPPSKPYYELEGVYKESKGFSKVLVFSSWEMVPRMIGSLISYEEERRTVGLLSNASGIKSGNNTYFSESKSRYPAARLKFTVSEGKLGGMYLFCLIYPSETLAAVYEPIEYLNYGYSLTEIRKDIKRKLRGKVQPLLSRYAHGTSIDKRWYFIAPMLLDGLEYAKRWLDIVRDVTPNSDDDVDDHEMSDFDTHLKRLEFLLDSRKTILGQAPEDLLDVLANMTIGSFAVCAYRAYGGDVYKSTELARVFIKRFNSTEATAAVLLSYSDKGIPNGDAHWRKALKYCCDGGFGAMLDEYIHMVSEGTGFGDSEDKNQEIHETMIEALQIRTASYRVDTYPSFCNRMQGEKYQTTLMRSHYAVGYTKSEGNEKTDVKRKDTLRNAFNSPMRPFVLATTSIGQEGLDFHFYCRKIMHWNLPSNPIDLEQREGRINRYKCLAIRQDLAQRFSDRKFISDVWQELFSMAIDEIKCSGQPELVPFWCLGKNQTVKIERIIPMYPVSKDDLNYQRLMKVLSLYRLTLGQARQEDLVNYFLEKRNADQKLIQELFINLCPYSKKDEEWKSKFYKRKPARTEKKKSPRQVRIEALKKELDKLYEEKAAIENEEKTIHKYKFLGMKVYHKTYKNGEIIHISGKYIRVKFDKITTDMALPGAFFEGFLVSEYSDFNENLKNRIDLVKRRNKNKENIERVEKELKSLII